METATVADTMTATTAGAQQIATILSTQSAAKILWGVALLILGLMAVRGIMKLLRAALDGQHALPKELHSFTLTTVRIILDFIVIVVAAGAMGIPVTTFVAAFSVIGLAFSLAAQGVLSNLVGGIIILISKPYRVGDFIEVSDIMGTVKEIGFLYTELTAPDGRVHRMPNSTMFSSRLTNYTENSARRVELSVSASYADDPESVRRAIMSAISAAEKDPTCGILRDPAPRVMVASYGDSSISYQVWVWCRSSTFLDTKFRLNEQFYASFREHHVTMTYPHLNVHMDK